MSPEHFLERSVLSPSPSSQQGLSPHVMTNPRMESREEPHSVLSQAIHFTVGQTEAFQSMKAQSDRAEPRIQ